MIFIRMTKQIVPEIPRRAAEIQVITPAAIAAVETVAERCSQGGSTSNDDTTYNQDDTTYQDENNTPQQ